MEKKTETKTIEKKPSGFVLGASVVDNSEADVLDRLDNLNKATARGFLLLENGVRKKRVEFGTLRLIDISLIDSRDKLIGIKSMISSEKAIAENQKVYFTSQADADAFEKVYKSYGFTDEQFGGVLSTLKGK